MVVLVIIYRTLTAIRYSEMKTAKPKWRPHILLHVLYSTRNVFTAVQGWETIFQTLHILVFFIVWPHRPSGAGGGPHEAEQEADDHPHPGFRIRVWDHRPTSCLAPKLSNRRIWLAGRSVTNLEIQMKAVISNSFLFYTCIFAEQVIYWYFAPLYFIFSYLLDIIFNTHYLPFWIIHVTYACIQSLWCSRFIVFFIQHVYTCFPIVAFLQRRFARQCCPAVWLVQSETD